MNDNACAYCGMERGNAERCAHCGAPLSAEKADHTQRYEPFFLNGYIVWPLVNLGRNTIEYQFWQGHDIIESIELNIDLLRELAIARYGEGCCIDELLWELFRVAHGEQDAIVWTERDRRYPATFRITREENEMVARARWGALSYREILEAIHAG